MTEGRSSRPYESTKSNAVVAWDVGAMRYEKYTDECPAFVGWLALLDLPLTAAADTVLLPFLTPEPDSTTSEAADAGVAR